MVEERSPLAIGVAQAALDVFQHLLWCCETSPFELLDLNLSVYQVADDEVVRVRTEYEAAFFNPPKDC